MPEDALKISQLENIGAVAEDDLFLISKAQGDGTYVSRSGSATDVALFLLENIELAELTTAAKTIIGAINELDERLKAIEEA